jgi:large subunit ribosomal protein L13
MASYVAFVIQGKSHPLYKPHQVDFRDKVVIVNGKYVKLSGKKLETKLYRHHTSNL